MIYNLYLLRVSVFCVMSHELVCDCGISLLYSLGFGRDEIVQITVVSLQTYQFNVLSVSPQ